jgi:hypothetical protein
MSARMIMPFWLFKLFAKPVELAGVTWWRWGNTWRCVLRK